MENKVLEKNLNHIKEYDLKLYNEILMFDYKESNFSLEKTLCDEYNLIFKGTPLHNPQGAMEEVKNIVSQIKDENNTLRIVYGLGLGYLPDEISNKIKLGKIIIYEPNLELLNLVFSIAEIDALFNNNVVICSNEKTLMEHIHNFIDEKTEISISFLNSYKNLYLNDIKRILNLAQEVQGEVIGNKNTFLKKAPSAILNTMLNLKNILKNPSISQLKDIYKGKTAIILCAGPSLKENIHFIKENQDKFVIFALNPVVKLLNSMGIKADFIVDIETINTISQFSTIDTSKYYFILESFCNYHISNFKTKKTFNYISSANFINDWLRKTLNIDDMAQSCGTVSYTALISAFIMGFEKIIIVGQDLAYKDGNCYTKGSQYEDLECVYDEKLKKYIVVASDFDAFAKSLENQQINEQKAKIMAKQYIDFMNKNLVTVKSQNGKLIPSKTDYLIFIKFFSEAATVLKELNPNLRLINSSIGGAQIDGFENVSLEQLEVGLEVIEKLNLDDIEPNYDKTKAKENIIKLLNAIKLFKTIIEDLIHLGESLIKELENKKIFTSNFQRIFQKYKELLSYILKQQDNEQINFVLTVNLIDLHKTITNDAFKDETNALKTLKELDFKAKRIDKNLETYVKSLINSQSIIL